MAELLEVCVTALRSMMKDVAARAQLRHLNSIPTFVQVYTLASFCEADEGSYMEF